MGMKDKVELKIFSKSIHTSAIITGFLLLQEQGKIDLFIDVCYDQLSFYPHSHLVEIRMREKVIAFDLLDGYNWDINKIESYLDNVDYYFKRSFCLQKNQMISSKNRIKLRPLGFNYHVTHKDNPIDKQTSIKDCLKSFLGVKPLSYFTTSVFEVHANFKKEDLKVLFFTRLWETNDKMSQVSNIERDYINQMRIQIIRDLKKIYPNNFVGGIQYSELATKVCKDLIMPRWYTIRNHYLDVMKLSDICIGSMGLHESIGWKTGEYIAASRAIVNEKLHYEVVGPFAEGKNYLSFESVEQCLQHVSFLLDHPEIVYSMKKENERYYKEYLRPDKLVLHAIKSIFIDINNVL